MAIDDNTTYGLTGAQIKELPSKIQGAVAGVAITGAGAPTTATVGTVGKLYEDTTNGKLYICTAVTPGTDPDPDTYTWEEVGAGGGGGGEITTLTSADYNWPVASPDGINPVLLPAGLYKMTAGMSLYMRAGGTVLSKEPTYSETYIAAGAGSDGNYAYVLSLGNVELSNTRGGTFMRMLRGSTAGNQPTYRSMLACQQVVNNLTSTETIYPLSANQGKVLNDKITPSSGSGAPTTSTSGVLGKIYIDTSTDNAYMCTKVSGSTYTWKQITS